MVKSPSSCSFWVRNLVRAALFVSLSAAAGRAQQLSQNLAGAAALPDAPLPQAPMEEASSVSSSVEAFLASQNPTQNPQQPGAPSLDDLGMKSDGDVKQQALMDRRTHMLKVHQRLGLITVIPVAAACISSAGAPPDHGQYGNTTSRDVHVGIAGLAIAMYGATAYYAIRAPKVSNEPARGGVKWHKYLIYLHAPGMVLTPILAPWPSTRSTAGRRSMASPPPTARSLRSPPPAMAWPSSP